MGKTSSSSRPRRSAGFLLAFIALLGITFWLRRSPDVATQHATSGDLPERSQQARASIERAADGVPIISAGPDTKAPDEPMHPHPITPAHERIFRENNLVGALNLAVDLKDARRLRAALAEYRAEYPEDSHRLQEGYAIIADCLEQLDEPTRERAQRFWSTEIRSQTRRYVRRYCLEKVL